MSQFRIQYLLIFASEILIGVGCTVPSDFEHIGVANKVVVDESMVTFKMPPSDIAIQNGSNLFLIVNNNQLVKYNYETGKLIKEFKYDSLQVYMDCLAEVRQRYADDEFISYYEYEDKYRPLGSIPSFKFSSISLSGSSVFLAVHFLMPQVQKDQMIMRYENFLFELSNDLSIKRKLYYGAENAFLEYGFFVLDATVIAPNLLPISTTPIPLLSHYSISNSSFSYISSSSSTFDTSLYSYRQNHSIYHPSFSINNSNGQLYFSDEKRIIALDKPGNEAPSYLDSLSDYRIQAFSWTGAEELALYIEEKNKDALDKKLMAFDQEGILKEVITLPNFQDRTLGAWYQRKFIALSMEDDFYFFTAYEVR